MRRLVIALLATLAIGLAAASLALAATLTIPEARAATRHVAKEIQVKSGANHYDLRSCYRVSRKEVKCGFAEVYDNGRTCEDMADVHLIGRTRTSTNTTAIRCG